MKETLGSRIRTLRKQKKWTQRELAERIDVDFTYLSKIENDSLPYTPSTKTLRKLASELEADELELLRLADKLPAEMKKLVSTERGLQFMRQASKLKTAEDWEDLFAFLDGKADKDD